VISFRYHLVSVVAVLFALAIGIVVGSGFLGGPLRRQINSRLNALDETADRLRSEVATYEEFAEAAEARMTDSALLGESVVLFSVEGTNGTMVGDLRAAVERAGGEVPLTITALGRFALTTTDDRVELGEIIGSQARAADDLRRDAGELLGTRAAAAAATAPLPPRLGATAGERFDEMIRALADAGFVALDEGDGPAVPSGARFLIAAGSTDPPPYSSQGLLKALAVNLTDRGAGVLSVEPSDSVWGVVGAIREDGLAIERVSTVDDAETIPGRIATVLELDQAAPGRAGHYGAEDGAAVLPEPTPAA